MNILIIAFSIVYFPIGIGIRNLMAAYLNNSRKLDVGENATIVLIWPFFALFCAIYPPPPEK